MQARLDPKELTHRITAAFPALDARRILRTPLIIVSAPRSGSNLLFEQLTKIDGFWTIGGESHAILRAFPHLIAENAELDSGRLIGRHADPQTRKLVRNCFLYLARNRIGRPYLDLPEDIRPSSIQLLEKTPRNALNIPFLLKVFPDARFVYLYRDPRQVIASLIEAWTIGLESGRFRTFDRLPGWDLPGWCFLLPPGWRELRGKSLAEIATFQWTASNRIIMQDLASLSRDRLITVDYGQLVADPQLILDQTARFAGIKDVTLRVSKDALPLSRTTVSPPGENKWRRFEKEIKALQPTFASIESQIPGFCKAVELRL